MPEITRAVLASFRSVDDRHYGSGSAAAVVRDASSIAQQAAPSTNPFAADMAAACAERAASTNPFAADIAAARAERAPSDQAQGSPTVRRQSLGVAADGPAQHTGTPRPATPQLHAEPSMPVVSESRVSPTPQPPPPLPIELRDVPHTAVAVIPHDPSRSAAQVIDLIHEHIAAIQASEVHVSLREKLDTHLRTAESRTILAHSLKYIVAPLVTFLNIYLTKMGTVPHEISHLIMARLMLGAPTDRGSFAYGDPETGRWQADWVEAWRDNPSFANLFFVGDVNNDGANGVAFVHAGIPDGQYTDLARGVNGAAVAALQAAYAQVANALHQFEQVLSQYKARCPAVGGNSTECAGLANQVRYWRDEHDRLSRLAADAQGNVHTVSACISAAGSLGDLAIGSALGAAAVVALRRGHYGFATWLMSCALTLYLKELIYIGSAIGKDKGPPAATGYSDDWMSVRWHVGQASGMDADAIAGLMTVAAAMTLPAAMLTTWLALASPAEHGISPKRLQREMLHLAHDDPQFKTVLVNTLVDLAGVPGGVDRATVDQVLRLVDDPTHTVPTEHLSKVLTLLTERVVTPGVKERLMGRITQSAPPRELDWWMSGLQQAGLAVGLATPVWRDLAAADIIDDAAPIACLGIGTVAHMLSTLQHFLNAVNYAQAYGASRAAVVMDRAAVFCDVAASTLLTVCFVQQLTASGDDKGPADGREVFVGSTAFVVACSMMITANALRTLRNRTLRQQSPEDHRPTGVTLIPEGEVGMSMETMV